MSRYGVGAVGVAALRRRPSHAAEQVTQVLYGETYRVFGTAGGGEWLRVRLDADGHEGWVRAWHGVPLSAARARAWRRRATLRTKALAATVRSGATSQAPALAVLPWASRLAPSSRKGTWWKVGLPDGSVGFVRAGEVVLRDPAGGPATPAALERTARALLGVPYEWGGRSSWGMDCSGFVQAVFAWHGVRLPRDAWQQAECLGVRRDGLGRSLTATRGGLAFFGPRRGRITHVGLLGEQGSLYHALGRVRVDGRGSGREPIVKRLLKRLVGIAGKPRCPRQSRQKP